MSYRPFQCGRYLNRADLLVRWALRQEWDFRFILMGCEMNPLYWSALSVLVDTAQ